jgi:hypothetical protein
VRNPNKGNAARGIGGIRFGIKNQKNQNPQKEHNTKAVLDKLAD